MATRDEYAQWLVDNQDKKGSPEFETVATAYRESGVAAVSEQVKSVANPPYDPTTGMSGLQKFTAGAGKAVADLGRGAAQLVGKGPSPEEMDAIRKRDEPLMKGAGFAGNLAMNVGMMVPTMAIPGANTLRGAAALGGGVGALTPRGEGDSLAGNVGLGAALGAGAKGGLDLAGKGAGKLFRAGESYLPSRVPSLAGRALNEAGGDSSQAFRDALRQNPNMSVGQAGASARSPELSAIMKMASEANPSLQTKMTAAENANIKNAMRGITGTGDDLEKAMSSRAANADQAYKAAYAAPVNKTPGFQQILEDPFVKKAMVDVSDTVKSKGVAEGSTEYYHLVKKALDDISDTAKDQGFGKNKRAAMKAARKTYIDELGRSNPLYEKARIGFEIDSPVINQMQVGRALDEKLFPAIADVPSGGQVLTGADAPIREIKPTAFMTALRGGDKTAQKATGFKGTTMADALGGEMGTVKNIQRQLQNTDDFNALASKGSRAANSALQSAQTGQLPGILERNIVIANSLLSKAGKNETKSIMKFLSKNIDNPTEIARIMENASPEQNKAVNAIIQSIRQSSPVIAAQGVQ